MTNKLRSKMRVNSVTKKYRPANYNCPDEGIVESMELSMMPVYGAGNEEWNKSTPSGELKLLVNNTSAFPFIEAMPGKEFYVDILPID